MVKLGKNDLHLMVSGKSNTAKLFDASGKLLKTFECFPHGVNGPAINVTGGDTVPGTYRYGNVTWTQPSESIELVKRPYGPCFIEMVDVERVEAAVGRAGIGSHGGGSWEDYDQPFQKLALTMGCIRFKNQEIIELGKLVDSKHATRANVYVTVSQ